MYAPTKYLLSHYHVPDKVVRVIDIVCPPMEGIKQSIQQINNLMTNQYEYHET
jgi:hypothetical protein